MEVGSTIGHFISLLPPQKLSGFLKLSLKLNNKGKQWFNHSSEDRPQLKGLENLEVVRGRFCIRDN